MRENNALSHDEANELLGDYAANELSEQQRLAVEQHLHICEVCQYDHAEITRIRLLLGTLRTSPEESVPNSVVVSSSSLADTLLARLNGPTFHSPVDLDALLPGNDDEISDLHESGETVRPLFSTSGVVRTEAIDNRYSQRRLNRPKKKHLSINNQGTDFADMYERTYTMESHSDYTRRTRRSSVWITLVAVLVLVIVSGSLLTLRSVLLANHNAGPGHTPGITTPLPHSTPTSTSVVTQPVPPTQNDCPAANTARAMVTAPLAQGKDPQIVYVAQTGNDVTTRNRIISYDTVTHTSTELFKVSSGMIGRAILSADGQWLLIGYVDAAHMPIPSSAYVQLQALRIDGQGLQTVYCGQAARLTWSPDRRWIAFDDPIQAVGVPDTVHMIDTTTGQLLAEVDIPEQDNVPNPHNPLPAFWLSNTQLYLEESTEMYLVDTANGEHQSLSSLKIVSQQTDAYTAGAVADGTNLFINEVVCSNGTSTCSYDKGKTALVRMPAQGGAPQTIFQDTQRFIDGVGLIDMYKLLVVASNQLSGAREIFIVRSDGNGQTLLTSAKAVFGTGSGQVNPYPYIGGSGVVLSADGQHFAVTGWPTADGTGTQTAYGSPSSSVLTPLDTNGDTISAVLGWTQL